MAVGQMAGDKALAAGCGFDAGLYRGFLRVYSRHFKTLLTLAQPGQNDLKITGKIFSANLQWSPSKVLTLMAAARYSHLNQGLSRPVAPPPTKTNWPASCRFVICFDE